MTAIPTDRLRTGIEPIDYTLGGLPLGYNVLILGRPPRRVVLREMEDAFRAVRRIAEGRVMVRPPTGPLDVEAEFTGPEMGDVAHLIPGSVRASPTTLRSRAKDALEAYGVVRAFMYPATEMARWETL